MTSAPGSPAPPVPTRWRPCASATSRSIAARSTACGATVTSSSKCCSPCTCSISAPRSSGCVAAMRWLALVVLASLAAPARADDQVPATHQGQFGLSLRLGLGVRGIATYNSDYCGVLDSTAKNGTAPVCTGRAPFAIDIEPSYGVAKAIELVFGFHVGLESDFGPTAATLGPKAFRIEPGARFFFSEYGHSKLFVQPALVGGGAGGRGPGGAS